MAASLKQTVSLMSKVTANMPLTETSKLMDSLEKNFEDLEVKTKVMDDAMQNATTVQQPVDQVANLMREMADEAGIELNLNMPTAPTISTSVAMQQQVNSSSCSTCSLNELMKKKFVFPLRMNCHKD